MSVETTTLELTGGRGWDAGVGAEDVVERRVLLVDGVQHKCVAVPVVYVQDVRHQDVAQEPTQEQRV